MFRPPLTHWHYPTDPWNNVAIWKDIAPGFGELTLVIGAILSNFNLTYKYRPIAGWEASSARVRKMAAISLRWFPQQLSHEEGSHL